MLKFVLNLLFLIVFLGSNFTHAQVKMLLLDGNTIETNWLKYNKTDSLFYYKNKKNKYRFIEKEFIYSISEPNKESLIIYKPDSIMSYSALEMGDFLRGEIYVKKNYKPRWAFVAGIAAGASGTLVPYSMGINIFHSSFIPLAYAGYFVFFGVNENKVACPINCDYPYAFKRGYAVKAQKKRFYYIASGTFLGASIGFLTYSIKYH